jgi:hypothetical protein
MMLNKIHRKRVIVPFVIPHWLIAVKQQYDDSDKQADHQNDQERCGNTC